MTVSPDARTPSADVHALSGSSAGPGRPFAPLATVHEMPDPFVPLGDAAAGVVAGLTKRREAATAGIPAADPDAEVIDLAGRVKRLAEREERLVTRQFAAEDAVDQEARPLTPALLDALSPDFKEAQAAHDRHTVEIGIRLGLPRLEKLSDRAARRLERWGSRLARTVPLGRAGLTAKAGACKVVTANFRHPIEDLYGWRKDLSIAVSDDALRIIGADADARTCEDGEHDAALHAKLDRWEAITAGRPAMEAHTDAAKDRAYAAYPPRPAALYAPATDLLRALGASPSGREHTTEGRVRLFYHFGDIEKLRAAPPPTRFASVGDDHAGPIPEEIDERGEARRQEIITAGDAWVAAREAVDQSTGYAAALETWEAQIQALNDAEDAVKLCPPQTSAGLARKARWVADLLAREAGDDDLAEVFARQVAAFGAVALPEPNLRPVPIDRLRFPVPRYPTGTSLEEVESYRTFLWQELRHLEYEVYGTTDEPIPYWMATPAGRFHGSRGAPASTRAALVLGVLGLLPTETMGGKPLPAASAA